MEFSAVTALVGLLVGFFVGLTGVGGGVLLAPLLIALGVQPTVAVGTDMVYGTLTKLTATVRNVRAGRVDWRWVRALAAGSVPAGLAGSLVVHWLRSTHADAEGVLLKALGAVLALAATMSLVGELLKYRGSLHNRFDWTPVDRRSFARVATFGAVIGFIVGLTSVGSGSLIALLLVFGSKLAPRDLIGTDIAHATLLVTAASLAHAGIGTVDWALAANLLCGSIPGVLLGSRLMDVAPARPLKVGMCSLVWLAGAKMLLT